MHFPGGKGSLKKVWKGGLMTNETLKFLILI